MTTHITGTREEWLADRLRLLKEEKELTRRSDELARRRQQLPWVRIDKEYVFDTDEGEQSLRDLFAGRSQLLVYHFMFGPTWSAGCATCTLHAESFDRAIIHLNQRDVTMVCVSRAPLAQLNAYKQRMGLTFRWVSSLRSDFNYDFGVSLRPGADPDKVPFNFGTSGSGNAAALGAADWLASRPRRPSQSWRCLRVFLVAARRICSARPRKCVTAEWNGPDVLADERLPFGALAEAGLRPTKRCPPVLIRRSRDGAVPNLPRP